MGVTDFLLSGDDMYVKIDYQYEYVNKALKKNKLITLTLKELQCAMLVHRNI